MHFYSGKKCQEVKSRLSEFGVVFLCLAKHKGRISPVVFSLERLCLRATCPASAFLLTFHSPLSCIATNDHKNRFTKAPHYSCI